jgi:hypothetical protein
MRRIGGRDVSEARREYSQGNFAATNSHVFLLLTNLLATTLRQYRQLPYYYNITITVIFPVYTLPFLMSLALWMPGHDTVYGA